MLIAAVLMQCWAARGGNDGCQPMGMYEDMAECRKTAADYSRFDIRALKAVRLPILVSYKCHSIKD